MTLVDTATAAVALGVSPATVRWHTYRGHLRVAARDGRRNLYALTDLGNLRARLDNAA